MNKIKAVIFDLDGTLIDSRELVLGAFKHVLKEFDQPYDETEIMTHVGRILEQTYGVLAPNLDTAKLVDLHRSWQADNRHLLKGFGGLEEFLKSLKARQLKLGVFTSAVRVRADMALDGLGIRQYFDVIICGDDVTKPKPDKEGVVTLAKQMGIDLDEVIMVGDAEHDILSGRNAGVITIGISHGFGTKEAMQKAGADYIVDSLVELERKLVTLT